VCIVKDKLIIQDMNHHIALSFELMFSTAQRARCAEVKNNVSVNHRTCQSLSDTANNNFRSGKQNAKSS